MIVLSKKGKTFTAASTGCPRKHPFTMGPASKYLIATPSTNILIKCLLCLKAAGAKLHPPFWKYNVPEHIYTCHPQHWSKDTAQPVNLPPALALNILVLKIELDDILYPTKDGKKCKANLNAQGGSTLKKRWTSGPILPT